MGDHGHKDLLSILRGEDLFGCPLRVRHHGKDIPGLVENPGDMLNRPVRVALRCEGS